MYASKKNKLIIIIIIIIISIVWYISYSQSVDVNKINKATV